MKSILRIFNSKQRKFIFILSFLLYSNTLPFEYALDDKIIITHNQITKQGISGLYKHFLYDSMDGFWANNYGIDVKDLNKKSIVSGGRYRPLTMITHSIEYEFFGETPLISHFINTLLFALTCVLLYIVLISIFGNESKRWYWNIPFIATLIFAVHPIHTEVVANIKGRDEILSLFFALLGLIYWLKATKLKSLKYFIISGFVFFLSMLSKETSLPFLVIYPMTTYFFKNQQIGRLIKQSLPILIFTIIYFIIRFNILPFSSQTTNEILNNPFA